MRSAAAYGPERVDMPRWLYRALLRITGHWYDPNQAKLSDESTDRAVDRAIVRRDRAQAAIESYRRESALHQSRR